MPVMTRLLNGQAVKVRLASTSVTLMRGSSALTARAQEAPANPPPTTTTRPAAPCARAGSGRSAVDVAAAAVLMKSRRVFLVMVSILLSGVPGRNGSYFIVSESLGDAIHDG